MNYDNVIGLLKSPISINTFKSHLYSMSSRCYAFDVSESNILETGFINVFERTLRRNITWFVDKYM